MKEIPRCKKLEILQRYILGDSYSDIEEKSLAAAHSGLEETRRALKALRASPHLTSPCLECRRPFISRLTKMTPSN